MKNYHVLLLYKDVQGAAADTTRVGPIALADLNGVFN